MSSTLLKIVARLKPARFSSVFQEHEKYKENVDEFFICLRVACDVCYFLLNLLALIALGCMS